MCILSVMLVENDPKSLFSRVLDPYFGKFGGFFRCLTPKRV